MKSCRTASFFATSAFVAACAIAACQEAASPSVPPLTTALAPPVSGPALVSSDAGSDDASSAPLSAAEPPIIASFVDVPGKIEPPLCSRLLIAVAKGKITAMGEALGAGDVLVVTYPDPIKLEGSGLVLVARRDLDDSCRGAPRTRGDEKGPAARPLLEKKVVRANAAADLRWAAGTMSAHLDVNPSSKLSPELYLGRLEGTAGVAEHTHPGSWEILAAVEAGGTFVIDGTESRLGPRQIVMVRPGARHAWNPDPGSKLVAIQMYSPPGPEQRFVALAASSDKDAGGRDAH